MKKIFIISIISIIFLLLLIIFIPKNRSYYIKHSKNTDLSNERVAGIMLDDKMDDDFIKKHGKPVYQFQADLENEKYNYYRINDIQFATNTKKRITHIMIPDKVETSKGIGYTDSISEAIKVYGDSYYKRMEQSADIIGYVDHSKGWTIEFWYFNEEIVIIRLDVTSMN